MRAREPDPTLVVLGAKPVRAAYQRKGPPVVHLEELHFRAKCGMQLTSAPEVAAEHAAYFAVPCRDCFPDAPPAGCAWMPERGPGFYRTVMGLGWQIEWRYG